jgi:hypothetical protein
VTDIVIGETNKRGILMKNLIKRFSLVLAILMVTLTFIDYVQVKAASPIDDAIYAVNFVSIQDALDVAEGSNNKLVILEPGKTYKITQSLKARQNVTIKGNGAIIKPTNTNFISNAITDVQKQNFDVLDLTVDMSGATNFYAIDNHGMAEWNFKNVTFANGDGYINAYSNNGTHAVAYNTFEDCHFFNTKNSSKDMIRITSLDLATTGAWANLTRFLNCRFGNNSTNPNVYTLRTTRGTGISFDNCSMEGTKGIYAETNARVTADSSWLEYQTVPYHSIDASSSLKIINNLQGGNIAKDGGRLFVSYDYLIPGVTISNSTILDKEESWTNDNFINNPNFYNNADSWIASGLTKSVSSQTQNGTLKGSRVLELAVPAGKARTTIKSKAIPMKNFRNLIDNKFMLKFKLYVPEGYTILPTIEIVTPETFGSLQNVAIPAKSIKSGWNDIMFLFTFPSKTINNVDSMYASLAFNTTTVKTAQTFKISEPTLTVASIYTDFNKQNEIMLSAIPIDDSWYIAERVYNSNPVAGSYIGWVCVQSGTFKTVKAGTTGSIKSGSTTLTVNQVGNLKIGDYISVTGITVRPKITNIVGKTISLSAPSNATVANAVIKNTAPIFKGFGKIE